MAKYKNWRDKRDHAPPPKVTLAPRNFAGIMRGQKMLISSPLQIDSYLRTIPAGESRSVPEMRRELARQNGAEVTCPLTTGIFLRIVAEAAWEEYENGQPLSSLSPVWRVLDATAPIMKKVSFDPRFLLDMRQREGLPE